MNATIKTMKLQGGLESEQGQGGGAVSLELDPAFATATNATTPRRTWSDKVQVGAARAGVDPYWVREHFAARMGVWFHAGETVRGAVEMLVFSWRQSAVDRRADRELEHLRAAVRQGCKK